MVISQKLIKSLKDLSLDVDKSLLNLLAVYHDLTIPYPLNLKSLIAYGVMKKVEEGVYTFEIYEEDDEKQVDSFLWLTKFHEIYAETGRKIEKETVKNKMKKLFKKFPDIRKDEVIACTKAYVNEHKRLGTDTKFILTESNFIYNQKDNKYPLYDLILEYRDHLETVNELYNGGIR